MKISTALHSLLICCGSSLLSSLSANADILYYDGGTSNLAPANGNGAATGISGNWNTGLTNWDAGAGTSYVGWNNSNNDTAFFNAGTAFAAPTPGTVTLTSAITVGGIIFNTSGYTITGNTLTFGGTNSTVTLNNLVTAATISSAIGTSATNMTFTAQNPIGAATMTFGAAGGWTGSTTVNAGITLQLNSASTALLNTSGITLNGGTIIQNYTAAVDRISSNAITSYGGTLATATPNSAIALAETIGTVTLSRGLTTFVHNASGASLTSQNLILSGLSRTGSTNTSTVNFASSGNLNTTKNIITVTGTTATTAGQIIGPWATTGNTAGASDYAVYDGSSRVLPANMTGTGEASWTVSTDAYNNNVVTQTLGATRTIAALRNTAATGTLTLATGFNLETYGILNGATTTFTVAPGTGGVLTTPTGGGHLHLNAGNNTTGGTMTISAPVTNNSGNVTVVKSGLGTLNLTGANNFSGGITVNSGTVVVNNAGNSFATGSTGADVINGGALTYSTVASMGGTGRDLTFNGTGTFTLSAGSYTGGTLTSNAGANAVINEAASGATISFATTTGAGNIIYTIGSVGSRALNLGNASTFTGNLQGRLTNNAGQGTNNIITFSAINDAAGSAIQFVGGTGDGAQAFTITYNGTSALTFSNRQIQILQHVTGNNDIRDNILANNSALAANNWTINTDLLATGGRAGAFNATGTAQFILSGTNTGNNAFNGVISDGQYGQGANGNIGLTKSGTGATSKWILGGNNTYSGPTSVSVGILNIQHANALGSTAGGTTVANAAKLELQGGITTAAEALTLTPGGGGNAMLLNVSGNNTWSGSVTSNTATSSQVSRIQSDLDKLTMSGAVSLTGSAHQLVFQGDGDLEISGQITGVGRITSSNTGTGVRTLSNDSNSYTGATAVNGGTLAFTSIGNVGATSSALGAPVLADATIQLGAGAASTLRYVGTAIGGHGSDRVINLAGTTIGATIEANGTDALVLTATNTATGAGIKTLTLSGTNTDGNSIGKIVDNSVTNTTSVTKSGGGKWVLTGVNTYTGATAVNGGTLLINGSTSSTSLVTVGNTATLGGTGTIGGSVTVNNGGTLASGASIESLATGALTLNAGSTFAYEMNNNVAANLSGDLTAVTGTLDISATAKLTLTELGSGSWAANEKLTLISYSGAWNNGLFTYLGNTLNDGDTINFSGISWLFDYNDTSPGGNFTTDLTNPSYVTMTAVPEPRAALLGGLGLLMLRRRRR